MKQQNRGYTLVELIVAIAGVGFVLLIVALICSLIYFLLTH